MIFLHSDLQHIEQDERVSTGLNGDLYFSHAVEKDSRRDYCCFAAFSKIRTIVQKNAMSVKVKTSRCRANWNVFIQALLFVQANHYVKFDFSSSTITAILQKPLQCHISWFTCMFLLFLCFVFPWFTHIIFMFNAYPVCALMYHSLPCQEKVTVVSLKCSPLFSFYLFQFFWYCQIFFCILANAILERKPSLLTPPGDRSEKQLVKGDNLELECIPEGMWVKQHLYTFISICPSTKTNKNFQQTVAPPLKVVWRSN